MKSTDPRGWGCAPWRGLLWLLALARRRRAALRDPHWPGKRTTPDHLDSDFVTAWRNSPDIKNDIDAAVKAAVKEARSKEKH